MKEFFKKNWLLIIISLIGLFLRVYKLGDYPAGLTWDEPALGYNAYSILKTARDEYGKFLPLSFKSFGDYKPGLFIYVMVPFVAVFNLTKFAIRLPSALSGVVTIVAVFFLSKEIFAEKKLKSLPYLSSLLLAISPWSIHLSRGAWEVNFALTVIVLFVLCFFKFLKSGEKKWLIVSSLLWLISTFSYTGAKVFLICFTAGMIVLAFPQLKNLSLKMKRLGVVLLVFLIFSVFLSFKLSANRAKVMGIFSYPRSEQEIASLISEEANPQWAYFLLFHSEPLNMAETILWRYFNHFSSRFLFFEGDWTSPRHGVPYMGMMYVVEIPLLLLGLAYYLSRKKDAKRNILLWWLLTAPIPAAVTRDVVHGVRAYWMVIPLVIYAALGLSVLISWCQRRGKIFFVISMCFLVSSYLYFFGLYLDLYYVHFPRMNSVGWNYGMERVARIINESQSEHDKIVVSQYYGQPYIFYLFYTRYDPRWYQKQAVLEESPYGDVGTVDKIDKIEFRKIYWPEDRKLKRTLFIGDPDSLPLKDIDPKQAQLIEEIKFLDRSTAFRVIRTL